MKGGSVGTGALIGGATREPTRPCTPLGLQPALSGVCTPSSQCVGSGHDLHHITQSGHRRYLPRIWVGVPTTGIMPRWKRISRVLAAEIATAASA